MENKAITATVVNAARPVEAVYTAEELAENHNAFNASYGIVATALRQAGKEKATFSEAERIIEKFKNKEVK